MCKMPSGKPKASQKFTLTGTYAGWRDTRSLRLPFDADRYERYQLQPWRSNEARHFLYDERYIGPRMVHWAP